jgi:hypothetical protein
VGVAEKPADFAYDISVGDTYSRVATVTVHSAIYREYLPSDGGRLEDLNALYTDA